MARPYSMDLRDRVVAAVKTGVMSCRQAAAHYDVGVSTAIRWLDRSRATGNAAPCQMRRPQAQEADRRASGLAD